MMPMRVIGMLLGIPESDQIAVRDANDANLRTKPGAPMKVAKADKIADGSIYADYVDWRAKNPSDDLMTALLNMEFEDENGVTRKLHRKEILHYTQVVAGAGTRRRAGSSAGLPRCSPSTPTNAARSSRTARC
jgi:cytochrome P450